MSTLGTLAAMVAVAVVFVLPGWLAYSGRWTDWVNTPYVLYAPLALLWIGAGGEFLLLGSLVQDAGADGLGRLLAAMGMALHLIGGISLFWTPPSLRPRWYRERER
ncbi:hypothetical protein GCM10010106_38850 [Thermopolyspora flexuosa]|jgi:hypothetical protein|uniref:Uncharacterized protein n=1 Tax=Thermopolyspora flexuosa TaxID=103836 RepID=A0A543J262_9ACTN|nr:hypothetical protein [Thermopolyspora flexuosa]TQM76924.1 hypothetical protein FHX40_3675 [Thermopolyspora flexuosa]GGM87897.1 hypothetical protein GCM10010106_38850 [Thermopolyspora flexuosa]